MDSTSDEEKVELVRKHSRQLVRELDVVKGSFHNTGCTLTQCHVLYELGVNKSLHLMQLADLLLIDKSNASRAVKKLLAMGLVASKKVASDNRQKLFSLTASGKKVLNSTIKIAQRQVESAFENLDHDQRETVIQGLNLFSEALRKARLQSEFEIRKIKKNDNADVANLIRDVMTEFGAVGEGYSIVDPEVDEMFQNYQAAGSCYYVIEKEGQILGVGGIAPLQGGDKSTCELRKMFFLPEIRGLGLGRKLLLLLMDQARNMGYDQCYLETLDRMPQAIKLYTNNGFERLKKPMGATGHCSCDHWYLLKLN